MKFDDRLITIITTPVSDRHDVVVRWRQLVDVVSRAGTEARSAQIDEALAVIRAGRDDIPADLRAATARAIAGRDLSSELLAIFASDTIDVAAPLLGMLSVDQRVRDGASAEVRRFLDAVNDAGLSERATLKPVETMPSIGEVVARIEQLRAARAGGETEQSPAAEPIVEAEQAPISLPPPALTISQPSVPTASRPRPRADPIEGKARATTTSVFRWECGPGGEIAWVEGAPRGPLVGRSIARAGVDEGVDAGVERAFGRRLPFRDAALVLPDAGVVNGDWLISGVPAFAPDDGRFVGYRGSARRNEESVVESTVPIPASLDPAALRELVHEIKTPLNAIIGFAEIIDGQYLGPAQSAYRARAAEIVAHARTLLTAVEDLDFAARAQGANGSVERAELASFLEGFLRLFRAEATARGVAVTIDAPVEAQGCILDRVLTERLLDRFGQAVVALAMPSETIALGVTREGKECIFRLTRPRALEGLSGAVVLNGRDQEFLALRLVAGLTRIAGGRLDLEREHFKLNLQCTG